jgi:hypothetical protein
MRNDYRDRVVKDLQSGRVNLEPGTVQHVVVLHEEWCSLLVGGADCNCEPEIVYQSEGGNA